MNESLCPVHGEHFLQARLWAECCVPDLPESFHTRALGTDRVPSLRTLRLAVVWLESDPGSMAPEPTLLSAGIDDRAHA